MGEEEKNRQSASDRHLLWHSSSAISGRVRIGSEAQRPSWNWEQQASTMLGSLGPETEDVQSMEEQETLDEQIRC